MKGGDIKYIVVAIIAIIALILAAISLFSTRDGETTDGANILPIAEINVANMTVEEMCNVSFNGSASTDADGTIVEYTWDFGDGTKDSGMHSSHIYPIEGAYNVTLTVRDDDGATDVTNVTITVTEQTTPHGSLVFQEDPNVAGKFYGTFQGSVDHDKIDISIYDASTGQTALEGAPTGDFTLRTAGGLNLTYDDLQPNDKIDATDTLILTGAGEGDRVTIVYRSTGEIVATTTLQ